MATELTMTMTYDAWLAEGERRFGADKKDWRFLCPACGHVASPRDFNALGDSDPSRATVECIGRAMDRADMPGERGQFGDKQPCNWAAYGLFGTLNGGAFVQRDGKTVNVFAFAEPAE